MDKNVRKNSTSTHERYDTSMSPVSHTDTWVCKTEDIFQVGQAIKQCNKTDGQYITPVENSNSISSILCSRSRRYYLRLKKQQNYVGYPAFSERSDPDRWTNSEENYPQLHKRPITYRGCYRFQNEEFMLYLDNKTCRENSCSHQFFAPILSDNTECRIEWSESSIFYGGPEWQIVSQNIDQQLVSIETKSDDIKLLRIWTYSVKERLQRKPRSKSTTHLGGLSSAFKSTPTFKQPPINAKGISTI